MEQVEEEASSSLTSYPLLNIKVKTMVPAEHDLSIGSGSTIRDLKLEVRAPSPDFRAARRAGSSRPAPSVEDRGASR